MFCYGVCARCLGVFVEWMVSHESHQSNSDTSSIENEQFSEHALFMKQRKYLVGDQGSVAIAFIWATTSASVGSIHENRGEMTQARLRSQGGRDKQGSG